MDEESSTSADAEFFRESLEELGLSTPDFARLLKEHGDHRSHPTLIRFLGRLRRGEVGVSGEMRALLGLLRKSKQKAV